MKTKIQTLMMLLMLTGISYNSQAATKTVATTEQAQQARVIEIKQRVEDIRAMDLKHLSSTERSSIKHELKDMKKELRQMGPGIYISVGALIVILIVVLLIL